jgi:hypothetical protein
MLISTGCSRLKRYGRMFIMPCIPADAGMDLVSRCCYLRRDRNLGNA